MKQNRLVIFAGASIIAALYGFITFQWLFAICVIVLLSLALVAWDVYEKVSAMQQSLEKIERHLEEMQKSRL